VLFGRFITFKDMKDLLGTSDGEEDEQIMQMWTDGMSECACPLGRITYDDFRMFIKGQTKEREPGSPSRRSHAGRKSVEGSPLLQAVPEGTVSPQAKHQTFARFEEMSALESLKMPMLGPPPTPPLPATPQGESKMLKKVDIPFPSVLEVPAPTHKRTRSRSLGEPPALVWYDFDEEEEEDVTASPTEGRKSHCVVLPSRAIGELQQVIQDESNTPLVVNKALYRKHREFRRSVLEVSKLYDQKRQATKRQATKLQHEPLDGSGVVAETKRASLVMRRGSAGGSMRDSLSKLSGASNTQHLPSKSEHERNQRFEEAAKRSGRPRRPRQRTTSDLSGMLR
jgi:hypothetical protein